jgi:hypothetical protein
MFRRQKRPPFEVCAFVKSGFSLTYFVREIPPRQQARTESPD